MKTLTILICAVLLSFSVNAQVMTPAPSPSAKIKQTVGLTEMVVNYSRPSMRGRTIFGDLVPFNEMWRTGANLRTTIKFSDAVTIDGQKLEAGSYAIFTKPGETSWEIYFYTETDGGGTPGEWDESKVAAKTTTEVVNMGFDVQTFTISFNNLSNNSGTLGMYWEQTYVGVNIEVPTVEKAVKSIEAVMDGPSGNDYFSSATYYYQEGKDLNLAKEWIDKAVAMNDKAFWVMRQQSLIYAKMGDTKGAIEAAKRSLAVAEEAGNADYVKMNKDSLKEWGAL